MSGIPCPVEYRAQFWSPRISTETLKKLDMVQQRAIRMVRELENLSYEAKLNEPGVRRKGSEYLFIILQYLKKVREKAEVLFSSGCILTEHEAMGRSFFKGKHSWI